MNLIMLILLHSVRINNYYCFLRDIMKQNDPSVDTFKSKEKAVVHSFYNKPIDDDVVKADGKIGNSVAFRFNLSHVQFRKKW